MIVFEPEAPVFKRFMLLLSKYVFLSVGGVSLLSFLLLLLNRGNSRIFPLYSIVFLCFVKADSREPFYFTTPQRVWQGTSNSLQMSSTTILRAIADGSK